MNMVSGNRPVSKVFHIIVSELTLCSLKWPSPPPSLLQYIDAVELYEPQVSDSDSFRQFKATEVQV